jgi:hypothetical protein
VLSVGAGGYGILSGGALMGHGGVGNEKGARFPQFFCPCFVFSGQKWRLFCIKTVFNCFGGSVLCFMGKNTVCAGHRIRARPHWPYF